MSTSYPKPGGGPQRPPMAAKDGFGAPQTGAPRRPPIGAGAGPVGAPGGPRTGRPPISHSQYQPTGQPYGYNPQAFPSYGGVMQPSQPFYPHGMYAGGAPMMPPSTGAPSGGGPSMVAPSQAGRPMYGAPVHVPRTSGAPSKGPVASKPSETESRSMDAPSRPPAASSRRPPVVPSQPESGAMPPQSSQYPSMMGSQVAQRGPVGAPTMASEPTGAPMTGATRPPMAAAGKPPMAATERPAAPVQAELAAAPPVAASAGAGPAELADQRAPEKEAESAVDTAPKPWAAFTGAKKDPVFSSWAAQVRFVISGDTVKLALHKPPAKKYDPSKIILFTLEGLRAPRMPRRSGKGAEGDAFAYEARDYVRTVVEKKPVFFAVWRAMKESRSASPTSAQWRYFGDVYVPDESGNLRSLSDLIVANGWAQVKLREGIPAADWSLTDDEYSRLQKAQEKAKKSKIGRWADAKPAQRVVKEVNQKDNKKFFKRFDKQTVDAIVEKALSGSFFRIEIVPSEPTGVWESVLVYLAGAQCNRPGGGMPTAPFAAEALDWSEARVVGQRVKVTFLALDRKDNLYVKMDHPRGQLAESLLRNGLASYEAWTAVLTGPANQKRLLDSVKAASDARLNMYETQPFVDKQDEFRATVSQVMSGDTIIVTTETGEERRFLLASIRAPRRLPSDDRKKRYGGSGDESKADDRKEQEDRAKEDKFVFAAKNFVRDLIIGKKVTVKSEYERTSQVSDIPLQYASIMLGKTNVGVALLKEGLATVIKHRKGESKSMYYKELQDAEDAAERAKKGLFGRQTPEPAIDLTQNMAEKMTIVQLIALNNSIEGKLVDAVVEYVFRADRIKLYLPKQNVFIVCSLKGVRSGNDDWGIQATDYVKSKIFQRTVQFRLFLVLNMESLGSATPSDSPKKGGGRRRGKRGGGGRRGGPSASEDSRPRSPQYIGDIFYNETGKKGGSVNIAQELVTLGLTKIVHRRERVQMGRRYEMVERTDPILLELENAACEGEVGLWKEESKRIAEREAERRAKYQTGKDKIVQVTYIATAVTFWVIETENLAIMQRVAEGLEELKPVRVSRPKVGTVVAAMYEGQFARARIERQVQDKDFTYLVLFLDYGNRATVTANDMAELPQDLILSRVEPLAHRCCLAGLRTPPRSSQLHYWRDAGNRFAELAMGVTLNCKVLLDDFDDRKWYVDLKTEAGASINRTLVGEGLARNDPKRMENPEALYGSEAAKETTLYLREIDSLQKESATKMKNMWTNGDVADE